MGKDISAMDSEAQMQRIQQLEAAVEKLTGEYRSIG
jgi:hypothetical protein